MYLLGGVDDRAELGEDGAWLSTVLVYLPRTNSWRQGAPVCDCVRLVCALHGLGVGSQGRWGGGGVPCGCGAAAAMRRTAQCVCCCRTHSPVRPCALLTTAPFLVPHPPQARTCAHAAATARRRRLATTCERSWRRLRWPSPALHAAPAAHWPGELGHRLPRALEGLYEAHAPLSSSGSFALQTAFAPSPLVQLRAGRRQLARVALRLPAPRPAHRPLGAGAGPGSCLAGLHCGGAPALWRRPCPSLPPAPCFPFQLPPRSQTPSLPPHSLPHPSLPSPQAPSMSTLRGCAGCTTLGGRLYVVGGGTADGQFDTVEIFNPEINAWMPGEVWDPGLRPRLRGLGLAVRCAKGLCGSTPPFAGYWAPQPPPLRSCCFVPARSRQAPS